MGVLLLLLLLLPLLLEMPGRCPAANSLLVVLRRLGGMYVEDDVGNEGCRPRYGLTWWTKRQSAPL